MGFLWHLDIVISALTVIAKFTFHKTTETILTNAPKLKGTDFSIGENFSQSVQTARRHMVNFAKIKSTKFQIRYKTLHMGSKRYIFDNASQTVKEIAQQTPQMKKVTNRPPNPAQNNLSYVQSLLTFAAFYQNEKNIQPCDVIQSCVLTETWLTDDVTDTEILADLPNFHLYLKDREWRRRTNYRAPPSTQHLTQKSCGYIVWLHPKRYLHSVVCYRPPNASPDFAIKLNAMLNALTTAHPNAHILLFGDFNLPNINWRTGTTTPGNHKDSREFIDACFN